MIHSKVSRVVAGFVFLASAVLYFRTLAPTVVFWDVGEFIAAAKLLQVPHPPGSPLFLLLARLAMMIPFAADQAVRAHALSALLSALAVMFAYLFMVRVLVSMRGAPVLRADFIVVHASAVIGALTLAVIPTYWNNSIEAEVYGASMFFVCLIMWLALHWSDKTDTKSNEKYLLLIAYLIGLSLGVHLLALLAIFPVLMIVYFRRYPLTPVSFMAFALITAGLFFVVYPGIVKWLPGMMDGDFAGSKSDAWVYLPWVILILACYGIFWSYTRRRSLLHIALLSFVLVVLGYTTYTSVLIRANENLPMNENTPSNLARLTSYLGREQYGNAPLITPRRYSKEPQNKIIYTKYGSDTEFMMSYQINHMFVRYLGWNFIGMAGDVQDSGVTWKDTWALPFLLGLVGIYHHFKKDWKIASVFLTMFIIMGPVLALYQNQQEPQPRERDYFYVGAYLVFTVWIAVGAVACVEAIKNLLRRPPQETLTGIVLSVALFAAIPANLVRINYKSIDRTGNYVAWDYSYNILQNCAPDAILFTNGDNDTFPVWYLQDVEGIRRDVRIVNLSLANTPWYVRQLMDTTCFFPVAKPVQMSFNTATMEKTLRPVMWESRTMDLPVPREAYGQFGVADTALTNAGKISFTMNPTQSFGRIKAIRTQDIVVRDIIFTNRWKRPIYFSVTCSPDCRIGLDKYLWFEGLVLRLEPREVPSSDEGMDVPLLEKCIEQQPSGYSTEPQLGFKFRGIADPNVSFDENTARLMLNYRHIFIKLANHYGVTQNNPVKAAAMLDTMERQIPRGKLPMAWNLTSYVGSLYLQYGRRDRFDQIASEIEPALRHAVETGEVPLREPSDPYQALMEIYDARHDLNGQVFVWRKLAEKYPQDQGVKARLLGAEAQLSAQPHTFDSSAAPVPH